MSEPLSTPEPIDRALVVHRIVQAGMLIALVWKWSFFADSARLYARIPLDDPFFPDALRSVWCIVIAYLTTIGSIGVNLFTANRRLQHVCSLLTLGGATILCIHQGSYNDMTFVTAWWTSLWALWFVHHLSDEDQNGMLRRAALLSRLILSMILLGGAAGKWTAEYWSGEVFYDIYFLDRDYWLFNLLRENFDTETLREICCWYSRKVVVIETVAGLGLWMLPPRWAAAAGVILLSSIALLSNLLLFSVLTSLIGLATVGFFVKPLPADQQERPLAGATR
jgi:hypothetical protein